jgi:hypothetical protein
MVLTPEQKSALSKQRKDASTAPAVQANARALTAKGPTTGTILNLLPYIQYIPAERNQGAFCGNCAVWAGTGIMEIALDVQRSIKDRLSIQYFDSNYNDGAANKFACCSIDEDTFVNFYSSKMKTIPWSNTNASFQDGSRSCFAGAARDKSQIGETPYYGITSIGPAELISTHTGVESVNIANIKSILDQHMGVEFDFYLTQGADWDAFTTWWSSQPESAIWSGEFSCGRPLASSWNGHGIVCVGYNDTDPDPNNQYWVMLNSWSTTAGRPNDLFRIPMHYNYECADSSGGYNTFWYAIPVTFSLPAPNPQPATNSNAISTQAPPHTGSTTSSIPTTPPVILPNITVASASLASSRISPGAPVTVNADIVNNSSVNGSSSIKLYINGQEESSRGITLGSGGRTSIAFTVNRNEPGTYTVYVGGIHAGTFTVEQVSASDIILWLSSGLIGLALIMAIIWFTRRRPLRQ